ncbi:hypothetical protein A2662_02055 [Candidatus Giovannonibacteria bacterium RIFCSPHIGHO2_01_FULL_45_33]|nr:MAG: hypothetical protein A2662_02055 [Candidatus Giovannonibacteria bacterium RIFCSPHIGHO2_01_FULL_45_33]OGF70847.1 MAG: hypothetical protein A3C73_00250 [Candidatus Giovannonibacteria bacterium RIFCSPHIGHO2_02_FULL_44_11]
MEFIFIVLLLWTALYVVADILLRLLFKYYFKEYEMDKKSINAISFKIAGAFLITSIISFFWARRLFIKAGMEKKDASKISAVWIIMLVLISSVVYAIWSANQYSL